MSAHTFFFKHTILQTYLYYSPVELFLPSLTCTPPLWQERNEKCWEMLRFADSASCCECDPGMPYLGQTSQPGSSRIMWDSTGRISTCWRRRWIRRLSGSTGVACLIKHSLARQLSRYSSAAQQFWNIHRPDGTLSQLWHDWITLEILTLVPSRVCMFFFPDANLQWKVMVKGRGNIELCPSVTSGLWAQACTVHGLIKQVGQPELTACVERSLFLAVQHSF